MEKIHSLLRRQLRKHLPEGLHISGELRNFVQAVNTAYFDFDADRLMLERSLELSSQELIQASSEMRAILQAIPDVLFKLDKDGTILTCKAGNPSDLYLSPSLLVGKRICDIPLKAVAARFVDALGKVRETNMMVGIEYWLDVQNGPRQYYDARLLPLVDNQIIVIIRNISERKQMEEELLKIGKLDSMSVLAGGIAHDFNNILTAIMGSLSLARYRTESSNENYGVLEDAEKACQRAKDLVKQLLTFSKGGEPLRKAANVSVLLRDSANFGVSGSNVYCEFSIADDLHPVNIDEGQISQVIHNLVINAQQAMSDGGKIGISAENVHCAEGDITSGIALQPGKYVRISVADHGVGIPQGNLQKIFDPYFTTKQAGSGLGLATAYSIVKRHEGCITVESQVGVGATFSVYLPASDTKPPVKAEAGAPKVGLGEVLVMDDEEVVRTIAGKMLQCLGYSPSFARSGEEAVELYRRAKENGRPIDVIIMDLTIPAGMGGKETIRNLLSIDPNVKAIVSSGYSDEPIMAEFKKYGFRGVVAKPYRLSELAEALQAALIEA